MRILTRLTQPEAEPIEVEALEVWVGAAISAADGTVDTDASQIISDLLTEQRSFLETELGRATVNGTWRYALDEDDIGDEIVLPMPPLVSVASITTYADDDTATVVDSAVYQVIAGDPGRIVLRSGQSWPSDIRSYAGMVIDFTAGYGADGEDCDPMLRTAVKALVTFWYKHRGSGMFEGAGGYKGEVPDEVARILHRVRSLDARPRVA